MSGPSVRLLCKPRAGLEEFEQRASSGDGVDRAAVCLLEVSGGFATLSDGVLGLPEREQQLSAYRGGGWLGDGAPQQRHRGPGCPARAGARGGQTQLGDNALVAGR